MTDQHAKSRGPTPASLLDVHAPHPCDRSGEWDHHPCERLRGEGAEARAALARQGRYHKVAGNLEVKEVVIDDGTMRDRFVICRNPDEAERDAAVRASLLGQLETLIAGSDELAPTARDAIACRCARSPASPASCG